MIFISLHKYEHSFLRKAQNIMKEFLSNPRSSLNSDRREHQLCPKGRFAWHGQHLRLVSRLKGCALTSHPGLSTLIVTLAGWNTRSTRRVIALSRCPLAPCRLLAFAGAILIEFIVISIEPCQPCLIPGGIIIRKAARIGWQPSLGSFL